MKLAPLDDRVVIKQSEAEEKSAGGIILPDAAKEKPQRGKIIAVGPGKILDNGKRGEMNVKKATRFFTPNIQATRSRLTTKNTSYSTKATYLA